MIVVISRIIVTSNNPIIARRGWGFVNLGVFYVILGNFVVFGGMDRRRGGRLWVGGHGGGGGGGGEVEIGEGISYGGGGETWGIIMDLH